MNRQSSKTPFVKLDDQVTLASTSARVVKTAQIGRVLGFGCHQHEQEALESLKSYAKQVRENPANAGDIEAGVHQRIQKLEQAILKSHQKSK